MTAIKQNAGVFAYASDQYKNDKETVLAAVKQNGLALQYASDELKNDREIVLAAVRQNGLALQFASDELKNDREIVLAAVQQNGLAIKFASDRLSYDRVIIDNALAATSGENLELLKDFYYPQTYFQYGSTNIHIFNDRPKLDNKRKREEDDPDNTFKPK